VAGLIESRRASSAARLAEYVRELDNARGLSREKACVCVVGSFGRGEATVHSDLDLVILGKGTAGEPALSRLDLTCIEADLIRAARKLEFPEFSGDGKFLRLHTVGELVGNLGKETDDVTNALTIRLLLLLESRPLFEEDVYDASIDRIIAGYWRDFAEHQTDFLPAFFANDVLRLWRTFCVNYEASTADEPDEKKAKRKLKNYKLKHSRLLTCYSGLAALLAEFVDRGTVTPASALEMVRRSPTQRLQSIATRSPFTACSTAVERVLACYEQFLETTDAREADLVARFMNTHDSARLTAEIGDLGDAMWELLKVIGEDNRMLRMMVV
jgi:hypothetical protein